MTTANSPTATVDFPHLFSPLQVGPITLRNRILVTAHVPRLAENNIPGPRYAAYHRAKARGGVALQITGATPVHASSGRPAGSALENTDDRIIPGYRLLADAVHSEGGRILAQLAHFGATLAATDPGQPMWAPSAVAAQLSYDMPHVMTAAEIAQIVDAFHQAALRVRAGGLDGIEILGAYGLLLAAFMSPYANKRVDDYGGSLENRMRFPMQVVDAVRNAAGSDLIVGMRIPGDEFVDGGLNTAAMQEIARRLEACGKLDYLNVIAGNNLDRIHRTTHWPPTPAPHGLFVSLAESVKAVVSLPVFTVGRIVDPLHAEQILAAGKADMVGMTRAHIADPDLPAKASSGRVEEIRPCVGANVCISHGLAGRRITCIHNPEAAREHELGPVMPATQVRRVAVIGGGPAGLEAARVAAQRGHRVSLFERESYLGGQFVLRSSIPSWREFQGVIDWRLRQLQQLQVHVELGRHITAMDIPGLEADVIILASGAQPRRIVVPGAESSTIEVATVHDVVRDGRPDARMAVVWDHAGGVIGAGVIEALVESGVGVHVITPHFMVAQSLDVVQRVPLYERILSAGVQFLPNSEVIALQGADVLYRNVYTQQQSRLGPVDLLVAWHGSDAVDDLREAIDAAGIEMHLIGDGLAPRTADIAIAEGALAGREI